MAKVNLRVLISATLLGKYTNSRVVALENGSTIVVPTTYYLPMVELAPKVLHIPDIDYEFFIDRSKDVIVSCQYHPDYIQYSKYVNSIDITGIKAADKIPVNEVPMEYVTIDDRYLKQPGGESDVFEDDEDDVDDDDEIGYTLDDDNPDGKPIIESICRYTSPNFEFKTADWKMNIRLYDYQFIMENDKPEHDIKVPEEKSWSIRRLIDKILHR